MPGSSVLTISAIFKLAFAPTSLADGNTNAASIGESNFGQLTQEVFPQATPGQPLQHPNGNNTNMVVALYTSKDCPGNPVVTMPLPWNVDTEMVQGTFTSYRLSRALESYEWIDFSGADILLNQTTDPTLPAQCGIYSQSAYPGGSGGQENQCAPAPNNTACMRLRK